MGTWSSSLYGNDTTSDVKDAYTAYLLEQLSNQEALERTIKDFEDLIGDEEESKETGRYGKYVLIQKTGASANFYSWMTEEEIAKLPVIMIIHVFDKLFDEMPTIEDVKNIGLLPALKTFEDGDIRINKYMELYKKSHYPKKHLFFLGNAPVPKNNSIPYHNPGYWNRVEESLNFCFSNFGGKEYEEVEERIYRFR